MGLLDRIRAAQAQTEGIDVRDEAVASLPDVGVETPAARRQEWGKPGRCPQCGGRGYLDHVDLVDRIMYQHCTECRHDWTVTEAELASH